MIPHTLRTLLTRYATAHEKRTHMTTTAGPRKYRRIGIDVEVMPYPLEPTVHDNARLHRWVNDNGGQTRVVATYDEDHVGGSHIAIRSFGEMVKIQPGDFVVRTAEGQFYPVRPESFIGKYVEVECDHDRVTMAGVCDECGEKVA